MALIRDQLIGPPHCYYLTARLAAGQTWFDQPSVCESFWSLLDNLIQVFDLRLFSARLEADSYHLVLRHQSTSNERDDDLRARWALLGGRSMPPINRLRRRLTTLGGLMQTLAQRTSRHIHAIVGGSGSVWASRYRSCLLADDASTLAATAWVARQAGNHVAETMLAPAPVRALPGENVLPADEAPLGLPPPTDDHARFLFHRFVAEIPEEDLSIYGYALNHGWALGHPESLTDVLSRLGRDFGRGRSRQLRDLDDQLGLCGVWG